MGNIKCLRSIVVRFLQQVRFGSRTRGPNFPLQYEYNGLPYTSNPIRTHSGVDLKPGEPRHQGYTPQDEAQDRRRIGDRPRHGCRLRGLKLPEGTRKRLRQIPSRRRRLQLWPAPEMVRCSHACSDRRDRRDHGHFSNCLKTHQREHFTVDCTFV